MSVLNLNAANNLLAKMFFDEKGQVGVVRYDEVKYPFLKRMAKTMRGFYWSPEEVDVNKDRADFQKLSPQEKHIFTANLRRVILIDSLQGRAPAEMLNPVTALPELENLVTTWTFFENIHSESYTHIIQNIYAVARDIFEEMISIPEITDCAKDISRYYDDYGAAMYAFKAHGFGRFEVKNLDTGEVTISEVTPYELKKKLWLMLMSINVMEGIRFYSSFACFWSYAERSMMEGNAKIIKLICRDENLHLSTTQKLLKSILIKDDPDFAKIAKECMEESRHIFMSAIEQEKQWISYLFRDGSMLGLNEALLSDYVSYLGATRMKAVGLVPEFKYPTVNPLPWTNSWIQTGSTQVAPQETELTQYVIGGINQDVESETFSGFKL